MATDRLHPEGLLGRKVGMTQIFDDSGQCIPVTMIEVGPCYILDIKRDNKQGYTSVQLGFEPKKPQRVNKPMTGHFAKAGKGQFYYCREVRCDIDSLGWDELGKELTVAEVFEEGAFIDVTGTSIGKGFAGVVKQYGVAGQPMSRGTHEMRRHIGSIGCRKSPGRVFKNRKMPGHLGNETVTIQNLKLVSIRPDDNVILVKGGIPGAKGSFVVVRKSRKRFNKASKEAA